MARMSSPTVKWRRIVDLHHSRFRDPAAFQAVPALRELTLHGGNVSSRNPSPRGLPRCSKPVQRLADYESVKWSSHPDSHGDLLVRNERLCVVEL